MKKSMLLLAFVFFTSCSQQNCEEDIKNVTEQYQKALGYTGGSSAAVTKLTADYNKKLAEINARCN